MTDREASARPALRLKICGLTQPEQARAIAALGVDAIGMIAVAGSPRRVEVDQAAALCWAVQSTAARTARVLVLADADDRAISAHLDAPANRRPTHLQLHGHETRQRCRALRQRFELPLWKALRIRSAEDLRRCDAFSGVVEALLLDAYDPAALGGTGHCIPMDWFEGFRPPRHWWLAGGMTPGRVRPAIRSLDAMGLRPSGIDACSGVECRAGVKDLARTALLRQAVTNS
ncbi:MAG: phosphoribosylanthranilate isomerase [Aphanocapsa feldmannii 288cV]|nr:MAG: phosphoribosylanthranilate isomerase [Aphanocapsa feldmannii 288cV]